MKFSDIHTAQKFHSVTAMQLRERERERTQPLKFVHITIFLKQMSWGLVSCSELTNIVSVHADLHNVSSSPHFLSDKDGTRSDPQSSPTFPA